MPAGDTDAHRIAVIGAGRIGLGIAETALLAGLPVVLAEASAQRAAAAPARLAARMRAHADAGLIEQGALERAWKVRCAADIAAHTSALDIEALAGFLERPGRFLGVHFFNPPEWLPDVEVVRGSRTDARAVESVLRFTGGDGRPPTPLPTTADRA